MADAGVGVAISCEWLAYGSRSGGGAVTISLRAALRAVEGRPQRTTHGKAEASHSLCVRWSRGRQVWPGSAKVEVVAQSSSWVWFSARSATSAPVPSLRRRSFSLIPSRMRGLPPGGMVERDEGGFQLGMAVTQGLARRAWLMADAAIREGLDEVVDFGAGQEESEEGRLRVVARNERIGEWEAARVGGGDEFGVLGRGQNDRDTIRPPRVRHGLSFGLVV